MYILLPLLCSPTSTYPPANHLFVIHISTHHYTHFVIHLSLTYIVPTHDIITHLSIRYPISTHITHPIHHFSPMAIYPYSHLCTHLTHPLSLSVCVQLMEWLVDRCAESRQHTSNMHRKSVSCRDMPHTHTCTRHYGYTLCCHVLPRQFTVLSHFLNV